MSSYIGYFNDIKGVQHTVTIGSGTTNTEITLTDTPFVTSMDESDDTIYKPVKYQSGTLGILSEDSDYLFDIYTGSAQGVKVTLSHGDAVDWVGYVTPSLYNIGYVTPDEPMDVDLIDGLSTLQYFKYDAINGTAGIHSLLDIIVHCVKKCGCYSSIRYSIATKIVGTDSLPLIEYGMLSEQFAFDDDSTETDRENDKTYQEVLEDVIQYLNLTCYAVGDVVYIVDVDNANITHMKEYDLSTDTSSELASDYIHYNITATSYATSDSTLSLDNTYQKVTVTDSFSTFDEVMADFFDGNEVNITKEDDDLVTVSRAAECVNIDYGGSSTNKKMLVFIENFDGSKNDDGWNVVTAKYYKHPKFTMYKYDDGMNDITEDIDTNGMNYTNSQYYVNFGAFLARISAKKLEKNDWCDDYVKAYYQGKQSGYTPAVLLDNALAENDISSFSMEEYVVIVNHTRNKHITNSDELVPLITMEGNTTRTSFFGGDNAYLILTGEIEWGDRDDYMYPIPDGEVELYNGDRTLTKELACLNASVIWGNYYFDGTEWKSRTGVSDDQQIFGIPFVSQLEDTEAKDSLFKSNQIVNTVTWRAGTDEQGFMIPMPPGGGVLAGNPVLTIYNSRDFCSWDGFNYNDSKNYYNVVMFIKNLSLKAVIADPTYSDEQDDDTNYTNVINLSNASELDDIEFSVCTYDGKNPNYNSVAYVDAHGEYHFVDTTINWVTMASEEGITRYDGTVTDHYGKMRQEEHLVWRITNQYTEPAKVLELTLNEDINPARRVHESNLDADFIIDKVDRDYKYCEFTYKLIEKK